MMPLSGSLSKVLRWIPYPVKTFDFEHIQGQLPPPLLEGSRDGMGKQPDPLEKASHCLRNGFQYKTCSQYCFH